MEKFKSVLTVLWWILLFCGTIYFRYRRIQRASKRRTRENILIGGFVLVLAAVIIGCFSLWHNWYYTPAPAPYETMDQAEADGCIIVRSPGLLERGQERWEKFYGMTNFGIPDTISIAVWDAGKSQVVNTLLYDGALYHYTTHNGLLHHDSTTETYPYLLHLRYEPGPDEDKIYHWKESYVLTDKADLTGEELAEQLYGENASFRAVEIISNYEWKDDP